MHMHKETELKLDRQFKFWHFLSFECLILQLYCSFYIPDRIVIVWDKKPVSLSLFLCTPPGKGWDFYSHSFLVDEFRAFRHPLEFSLLNQRVCKFHFCMETQRLHSVSLGAFPSLVNLIPICPLHWHLVSLGLCELNSSDALFTVPNFSEPVP